MGRFLHWRIMAAVLDDKSKGYVSMALLNGWGVAACGAMRDSSAYGRR